jgi:hypothetical protein
MSGSSKGKLSSNILYGAAHNHSTFGGALAEIVDNFRDAEAGSLDIRFDGQKLVFTGDGKGCNAEDTMYWGKSSKGKDDGRSIGGFGLGMKHALMHIAKDALVICRKSGVVTAALLSVTMHVLKNLEELHIPTITCADTPGVRQEQEQNEKAVLEFGPVSTWAGLMSECSKLRANGMHIICYNLTKRLQSCPCRVPADPLGRAGQKRGERCNDDIRHAQDSIRKMLEVRFGCQ